MRFKEILSKEITKKIIKKIICVILLLTLALVSIFVVSKKATSTESYASTIQSIDDKKTTVMGLTATAAMASTGLAAIPGDVTTPIANEIMEISSYLLIVVCVLVLEKSLLTVMGFLSFNILIPLACGLFGIYTFLKRETLKILAIKIFILSLVFVTIIPLSLKISDLIYEGNKKVIEQVANDVDESVVEDNEEKSSWWNKMVDNIKENASLAKEKAKEILNRFIDAIAIFLITYCVIPIVVVFIMIWFVKFLFGIAIPIPSKDKFNVFKRGKTIINDENESIEV